MKKIMFTLALVSLVFTSAQAQKQLGGEHNIELNLTPLGDSPIDGTTLKYRNFLDDDKALRISLMFSRSSDKAVLWRDGEVTDSIFSNDGSDLAGTVSPELFVESSTTVFGLALGYEKHFSGTDNLSPYIGFEGFFQLRSRNDMREAWGPLEENHIGQFVNFAVWSESNKQSSSTFGLNLLFGADYYFNDAIYVGLEAGLGFGVSKFGNHEIGASNNVAHNLYHYGNNADEEGAGNGAAIVESYSGQLDFNVMDSEQEFGFNGFTAYGAGSNGGLYTIYEGVVDEAPDNISKLSIGNVFNAAIRVGFLFD